MGLFQDLKQGLKPLGQAIGPALREGLKFPVNESSHQVDQILSDIEYFSRNNLSQRSSDPAVRAQFDSLISGTKLGLPLIKGMMPMVLKLTSNNPGGKHLIEHDFDEAFKAGKEFLSSYKDMRYKEEKVDLEKTYLGKKLAQKLAQEAQSRAMGDFLNFAEKWDDLKKTVNNNCPGVNLTPDLDKDLLSHYNVVAGHAFPKP